MRADTLVLIHELLHAQPAVSRTATVTVIKAPVSYLFGPALV